MKKFILAVLLILPCYTFAAPTAEQLYIEARDALNNYDGETAIPKLKQAAEMGNTQAQALLGTLYLAGTVIKRDETLGLQLLTTASEQGDAGAQFILGSSYLKGSFKIKVDLRQAEKWLLKAAEQGQTDAQETLGTTYYRGLFGKKDVQKARYWHERAVLEGNNIRSSYQLGWLYVTGEGGRQNTEKGIFLMTSAANRGDSDAQYLLGLLYADGSYDIKQDLKKAREWLTKAAKTIPDAQQELDALPEEKSIPNSTASYTDQAKTAYFNKDYDVAKLYALKAIKQNNDPKAQYLLGALYFFGFDVKQDYKEAGNWFTKSAQQNYVPSQLMLGIIYFNGRGVKQDFTTAHHWFLKAANQNHPEAQYQLAKMYASGQGVKQDKDLSIEWLIKAAKNGHQEAIELWNK